MYFVHVNRIYGDSCLGIDAIPFCTVYFGPRAKCSRSFGAEDAADGQEEGAPEALLVLLLVLLLLLLVPGAEHGLLFIKKIGERYQLVIFP